MKSPHYRKFKSGDYVQFFHDVYKICVENNPKELQTEEQLNSLYQTNIELSVIIKKDENKKLTDKIIYYDFCRDEAVICIRKMADAFTNHFKDDYIEAGKNILTKIYKYGAPIHKLEYEAETNAINKLSDDLKSNFEITPNIQKLSLKEVLEEMNKMNKKCNEYIVQRSLDPITDNSVTACEIIKQGRSIISALKETLVLFAQQENSLAHSSLINQLNIIIDRYNYSVGTREERNMSY